MRPPCSCPSATARRFEGVVDLITMKGCKFDGHHAVECPVPADLAPAVEEAREMLMDAAASADDVLTEKFLEEMTLSEADIIAGLKKGTLDGTVYPVFFTDAESEVGVPPCCGRS